MGTAQQEVQATSPSCRAEICVPTLSRHHRIESGIIRGVDLDRTLESATEYRALRTTSLTSRKRGSETTDRPPGIPLKVEGVLETCPSPASATKLSMSRSDSPRTQPPMISACSGLVRTGRPTVGDDMTRLTNPPAVPRTCGIGASGRCSTSCAGRVFAPVPVPLVSITSTALEELLASYRG
jgi:hypothetical protein